MPPPYRSAPLRSTELPSRFKPTQYLRFSELPPTTKLAPHIRSLCWSATGVYLAQCVASTIRIWSTERDGRPGGDPRARPSPGVEIRNAHGVAETVEKVAFCPNQEGLLASVGSDGKLRLWDVGVGAGGGGAGQGVAGAPAGPKANGGPAGAAAAAAATSALYAVGECGLGDGGWSLTWHPSGSLVLVGRQDDVVQAVTLEAVAAPSSTMPQAGAKQHYSLRAHDATPPRELHASPSASASRPDLRSRNLNTLAFSNAGSELLATTGDGRAHIYSWPALQHLHTLAAHTHGSYGVAHSPAGNYIGVGGGDALLTLWETGSLRCERALQEHERGVREVGFSWDGAYVVGGAGKEARESGDKAGAAAAAGGGGAVAGPPAKGGLPRKEEEEGNAGGLKIWATDTGELVCKVETGKPVGCVAWHPWRYWVAYGGEEGGVRVLGVGGL